ncbi:MAG: PIN domain nuclease [Alphaproteobacteria bacterium]|nr:PIN domain nuclease [Alphaproteobacteria bacterium]
MILVDSSVWIDYFNDAPSREAALLDAWIGQRILLTGDLIYAEVLQGFRSERDFERAKWALDRLDFEPMVGREVAVAAARTYRRLRGRGVTVRKTIDVLIGAFCLLRGHELLHNDRDFAPLVEHCGLRVV